MSTPYPFVPPNFALVNMTTALPGTNRFSHNLFGVNWLGFATPTAIAIATSISNQWATNIMPVLSTGAELENCEVTMNSGGVLTQADFPSAVIGSNAPPNCASHTAALIRKNTDQIGRHYRGRMYLAGLTVTQTDATGDYLSTAALLGIQNAIDSFVGSMVVAGFELYLLHRDVAIFPTPILTWEVETELATQRRRLRKVAHH